MNRTKGRFALAVMLGLGVLSFVIYSLFFSWGFAVLLLGSLVFHEYGHIWAMQRCGMKVSGIYLIPFVGGAAVPKSRVPSQAATAFIYLAGPAFGLALAAATAAGYLCTGWTILAGAAFWMAILNLFNLIPVFPLDGGGVLRSVAYSAHPVAGGMLQGVSAFFAFLLVFFDGRWLFWIVAFFAWQECFDYFGARPKRQKLLAYLSAQKYGLANLFCMREYRLHISLLLQELHGRDLLHADLDVPLHSDLLSAITVVEEKLREPQPLQGGGICYAIAGYAFVVGALMALGGLTAMVPGALENIMTLAR